MSEPHSGRRRSSRAAPTCGDHSLLLYITTPRDSHNLSNTGSVPLLRIRFRECECCSCSQTIQTPTPYFSHLVCEERRVLSRRCESCCSSGAACSSGATLSRDAGEKTEARVRGPNVRCAKFSMSSRSERGAACYKAGAVLVAVLLSNGPHQARCALVCDTACQEVQRAAVVALYTALGVLQVSDIFSPLTSRLSAHGSCASPDRKTRLSRNTSARRNAA